MYQSILSAITILLLIIIKAFILLTGSIKKTNRSGIMTLTTKAIPGTMILMPAQVHLEEIFGAMNLILLTA